MNSNTPHTSVAPTFCGRVVLCDSYEPGRSLASCNFHCIRLPNARRGAKFEPRNGQRSAPQKCGAPQRRKRIQSHQQPEICSVETVGKSHAPGCIRITDHLGHNNLANLGGYVTRRMNSNTPHISAAPTFCGRVVLCDKKEAKEKGESRGLARCRLPWPTREVQFASVPSPTNMWHLTFGSIDCGGEASRLRSQLLVCPIHARASA